MTNNINRPIQWLSLMTLLMLANTAYGWGTLGHQVVCDIAWRSSAPAIQRQLSDAAKRMGYNTFAESCTWADTIKSQARYDALKPLHYMNVARHQHNVASADCIGVRPPQCVLTAIDYYFQQMKSPVLSQKERDKALLLLGHFVADIHQPLHVSYSDDRGGTRKKIIFQHKSLSLHQLWDRQLLYCQNVNGKRLAWRYLGKHLFSSLTEEQKNASQSTLEWAQESFAITQEIYQDFVGDTQKKKQLADSYCSRYHPVAMNQLQKAGVRLANMLSAK